MHLDSVCTCVCLRLCFVCVSVCVYTRACVYTPAGVGGFVFDGKDTPAVLQFKVTNCAVLNLGCTTRGQ